MTAIAIADLTEHFAARDIAWSTATEERRARARAEHRAAGWTLCEHSTVCPPWDCQASYGVLPLALDDPLARWEWHGAAAFVAGHSPAPILDESVFFALASANPPIGDPRTLPRLAAWTRGWMTANLAAEVTG